MTIILTLVTLLLPGLSIAEPEQAPAFAASLEYFQEKGAGDATPSPLDIKGPWERINRSQLNFGFTQDVVWIRFNIDPQDYGSSRLLLEVANHKIDQLDLFVYNVSDAGPILREQFHVGDHLPIKARPYPTRNFVFPLQMEQTQISTVYLRVQNNYPMKLPINVWTPEKMERANEARILFQGIYFGVVTIMALYNLCIYFFVRDKSYGTYSLFILSLAGFVMIDRGLAIEYLWPSNPGYDFQMNLFLTALGSAASIPFTVHFLSLKQYAPRIAHAYQYLFATWILIAVVSLLYPAIWITYVVVIILIPGSISLTLTGILMWRKGVPAAPYYTLAWFTLVTAVTIYDAYLMGFLPISLFSEYSLQVGNMIEVTLLSLGLAHRIKSLDREKREAHLLTRTKSEFLATMSHEIRTPMNGILGMAELLKDTSLTQQQSTYLNTILGSGKTLMTVLNDILDYSKIEAGKLELEAEKYPVRKLLDETATIFSVTARDKGIYFNIYASPRVPASVRGDATRVRQIITNLLSNAFKFTQSGSVTLSADCDPDSHYLIVKVEDTGVGIPEHKQQDIFEQFTQAERSTNRQYGGTGLGLAISKRFVELMGGNIGVQSTPDKGSTFWFTLPLIDAAPFNQTENKALMTKARQQSILLACPDQRFTDQIVEYRDMWGFGLQVTDSLAGAENHLNMPDRPYDFVLLDQYCNDFSTQRVNQMILDYPALQQCTLMLTVDAGFDRKSIAGLTEAPIIEEYPISISNLQLAMIRRMGFSPMRPEKQIKHHDFSAMKILVVDDNQVNMQVVCGYLRKLNITPQCAASGQEALEKIFNENQYYDLVLMDCEMPGIDGYEATVKIREWEAGKQRKRLNICALSAHAMDRYRDRCFEVGMDGFLSKPIIMSRLRETLMRYQTHVN